MNRFTASAVFDP